MVSPLLEGNAIWIFQHDLKEKQMGFKFSGLLSFIPLQRSGEGQIFLTDSEILLNGDKELIIPLSSMTQIYLGFDEHYPATAVKNLGSFWQPLRIEYSTSAGSGTLIYLAIDYNGISTTNQMWYNTLTNMLK